MLGLPAQITVALFDLDGVLTSTATVHSDAWRRAFDAFLAERSAGAAGEDLRPFTERDYLDHVDGRPRLDGVRGFLASRGIAVDDTVVEAIAEAKNAEFLATLARDGVSAYPGSVRYLNAARAAGRSHPVAPPGSAGRRVSQHD